MEVETLGDAFTHSWRITARCAGGVEDNRTHTRPCIYREELDLHTLVWTRGRNFPLARLESRLMCPRCGNRRVVIVFTPPAEPRRAKSAKWVSFCSRIFGNRRVHGFLWG
jgi:hypothetical protein